MISAWPTVDLLISSSLIYLDTLRPSKRDQQQLLSASDQRADRSTSASHQHEHRQPAGQIRRYKPTIIKYKQREDISLALDCARQPLRDSSAASTASQKKNTAEKRMLGAVRCSLVSPAGSVSSATSLTARLSLQSNSCKERKREDIKVNSDQLTVRKQFVDQPFCDKPISFAQLNLVAKASKQANSLSLPAPLTKTKSETLPNRREDKTHSLPVSAFNLLPPATDNPFKNEPAFDPNYSQHHTSLVGNPKQVKLVRVARKNVDKSPKDSIKDDSVSKEARKEQALAKSQSSMKEYANEKTTKDIASILNRKVIQNRLSQLRIMRELDEKSIRQSDQIECIDGNRQGYIKFNGDLSEWLASRW